MTLFNKEGDYEAFERVLEEAWERNPIRILDYTVMPNHWHFSLWPEEDSQVTDFLRWLTHTHTMRWHTHYRTIGTGHLYQGRFKSFPIQDDSHLYTVLRYIERNPVRANLTTSAEQWRFGSAWRRRFGNASQNKLLSDWPIPRPANWSEWVNAPLTETELKAVRHSAQHGTPFGSPDWVSRTAIDLKLAHTLRRPGRPRRLPA